MFWKILPSNTYKPILSLMYIFFWQFFFFFIRYHFSGFFFSLNFMIFFLVDKIYIFFYVSVSVRIRFDFLWFKFTCHILCIFLCEFNFQYKQLYLEQKNRKRKLVDVDLVSFFVVVCFLLGDEKEEKLIQGSFALFLTFGRFRR